MAVKLSELVCGNENVQFDYKEALFLDGFINGCRIDDATRLPYLLRASEDGSQFDTDATIKKLFIGGYLRLDSIEDLLKKRRVDELERLLEEHGLPHKGKKTELVSRAQDNISEAYCRKRFPERYVFRTEKRIDFANRHTWLNETPPTFDEILDKYKNSGLAVVANALVGLGIFDTVEGALEAAQFAVLENGSKTAHKRILLSEVIDRKEWVYTGDYRNDSANCRNHALMDRQLVPKGQPFTLIGLDGKTYHPMYPRDPILPLAERKGCLCFHRGIASDKALGLSLEERRRLQQEVIDADDGAWRKELDARSKAKAGIIAHYAERNWKKTDAPYQKLEMMNKLLDALEQSFDFGTETEITKIADALRGLTGFSSYQLSQAVLRLADCYYSNRLYEKSLEQYLVAQKLNARLPIKRRLKELQHCLSQPTN